MNRLAKSYWPAIIWSAIVFILLAMPGRSLPKEDVGFHTDKIIHFGIFAVFVWLWCRYYFINGYNNFLTFFVVLIIGSAFGYAMELVQKYLVPNRDYDIWDWVADSVGAIVAYIGCLIVYRKK